MKLYFFKSATKNVACIKGLNRDLKIFFFLDFQKIAWNQIIDFIDLDPAWIRIWIWIQIDQIL